MSMHVVIVFFPQFKSGVVFRAEDDENISRGSLGW